MKYLSIAVFVLLLSCDKEKSIQFPEIELINITDIEKKSNAFMVYDDDSSEALKFNRTNFTVSRNWIISVDRRIKLKQLMPSLIALQNKKRDAHRKNKTTGSNYFKYKNPSLGSFGYMDFTDVIYHNTEDKITSSENTLRFVTKTKDSIRSHSIEIVFNSNNSVSINSELTTNELFIDRLKYMDSIQNRMTGIIYLKFDENLRFQDYLFYKSMIFGAQLQHAIVTHNEYIFN